jgi:transcriptional regulator with PAS, ATPase and Fis domain
LHFLAPRDGDTSRVPEIEAKLAEALCLYSWPLNVRELLLLATRLKQLHGSEGILRKAHLPERMLIRPSPPVVVTGASLEASGSAKVASPTPARAHQRTDDIAQFEALIVSLREHGTVAKAAEASGLSRDRAYRLIKARPEFSLEEFLKSRGP